MERRTRSTTIDSKEPTSCSLHYFQEGRSYKFKFTYFMGTIESFEDYVDPIQEAINILPFPTMFGQTEPLHSDLRQLVTLTPAQGGLKPYPNYGLKLHSSLLLLRQ